MKPYYSILAFLFIACVVQAQQTDPVHFIVTYKTISETKGEIHFTATIDKPWHIYAQSQPKEAIAQPTKFMIIKNPLVVLTGKTKELGKKETYHNKEVGITQYQYGEKAEFIQPISLKVKVKTNLSGTITYQACNDELCLPVKTIPFSIKIE